MKQFYKAGLLFLLTTLLFEIVNSQGKKRLDLPDLTDMLKPMSKSCKGKTGVSDELLEGVRRGEFPDNRKLMCYFRCLALTLKLMTKSGDLSISTLKKTIDTMLKEDLIPRMKEVLELCLESVTYDEDSCTYAYRMVECAYRLEPDMYFLP